MAGDGVADIAQARAGPHSGDALPHGLVGHLHQLARGVVDFTHQVRGAGIGDVAVLLQRDVEVDDLAIAQHIVGRRHAVADDVVDRGIEHVRETVLPFAGGPCLQVIDDHAFDDVVDLQRAAALQRQRVKHREDLR